jgi:thymidylate synthase
MKNYLKIDLKQFNMSKLDLNYNALLNKIVINGTKKEDRTGTGTISIFGHEIRHKMSDGFPLLTTKKLHFKSIVTELIWFLRGETNIKFLVDNNCNIWNGDAYKKYLGSLNLKPTIPQPWQDYEPRYDIPLSIKEFAEKIKTDDQFAAKYGELGPIYGKQWRNWEGKDTWYGIDQIERLINDLKNNPDSRRLMVNAWNPAEINLMTLPPCHYGFQCYTRNATINERVFIASKEPNFDILDFGVGDDISDEFIHQVCDEYNVPRKMLSLSWNQRSVDTFLGLPYNIASYGLLLLILAQEVGVYPFEMIGQLGDTHLYSNHIEQAIQQMERSPFDLPTVKINKPIGNGNGKILSNFKVSDFELINYQSHDKIEAPLSN